MSGGHGGYGDRHGERDEYDEHDEYHQHDQYGRNDAVNNGSREEPRDPQGLQGLQGQAGPRDPKWARRPLGASESEPSYEPSHEPSYEPSHGPSYEPAHPDQADRTGGGFGDDELALRRMMRGAVRDIEPSDAALDRLRHEVPARRARRRQAVVGAAAAALFLGTAVPALVHVTSSPGTSDGPSTAVGHTSQVPGGQGSATGSGTGGHEGEKPSGKEKEGGKDKDDRPGKAKDSTEQTPGEADSGGAEPSPSVAVTVAACDAVQLGNATAGTSEPDADGKVYGTFRVANVSDTACAVGGPGSVVFAAQGAADADRIKVVDHAESDPAKELPAPPTEPADLVLEPGRAYEVKFAWVPAESCQGDGSSPDPSPTPGDDGTSGGTTGGTEQSSEAAPPAEPPEGEKDGSVSITHTPEPGAPSAAATIPNACAGTIYRTGVLAAS